MHPEAEMGRYLTAAGFANAPPLLGDIVQVASEGHRITLAVALGFMRNQGDAWSWTLDHLTRASDNLAPTEFGNDAEADLLADCDCRDARLDGGLGEMHAVAGARDLRSKRLRPKPLMQDATEEWAQKIEQRLDKAFDAIAHHTRLGAGSGS